jgi:uncharacterized membrane protein/mono/diheme cytochrome c family protein
MSFRRVPSKVVMAIAGLAPALTLSLEVLAQSSEPSPVFWLWRLLGRLHPMVVHFPITLVFLVVLFGAIDRYRGAGAFGTTTGILLPVAAISSILATVLGLLLANTEEYGSETLPWHQWTGIVTTVLVTAAAFLHRRGRENAAWVVSILAVAGVTLTGHFGSQLTHGEDYLTSVIPSREAGSAEDEEEGARFIPVKGVLDEEQLVMLNVEVRSIFAHKCYSCHGPTRMKGGLRLDSREGIFAGGEHGPVIRPGQPVESEIIRRVSLPRGHKEAMPTKGNGLTREEIDLLSYWIAKGAPWPSGPTRSLFRTAALEPRQPAMPPAEDGHDRPIDRFVHAYFKKHDIEWGEPVDDRTYIRRVYLDAIGLVPHPDTVDRFVADRSQTKREEMVVRLLSRDHDYAQHWISFWNDALRNDYSGPGYITNGRKDITKWLYASLLDNKSYDRFVRELIDADETSEGFIRGIRWRGEVNASQRVEMQAAQNVSQVFFGLNLKCASCHDSFISDWKLDDAYAFANLFADSLLQIHRCDKPTGRVAGTRMLFPKLGTIDSAADRKERLRQLAEITVQPGNGRLYRTLVNRIWAQLMGRGIVEPVDAMDNRPWSQDLLDWLAWDFVANGADMKKLLFTILTSDAYQQPSVAVGQPEEVVSKDFVFRGMLRRRMSAEQFIDAIGSTLEPVYADSMIERRRLPDGIQFCIPFTRASLVRSDPFQKSLGRPTRENVSTGRTSQASLLQALELTNGGRFHETLRRAAVRAAAEADAMVVVDRTYRGMLGRLPSDKERRLLRERFGMRPSVSDWEDFLWAMALHPEFQLIR